MWLVHDIVLRRDWRALLRATQSGVDLAVAVSEAAAAPLRAAGLPVRVVRNGTVWPVDPAEQPPPAPAVVGCLGLLTPWKGQDVLLEAVAGLDPAVRVELAGGTFPKDEPYEAALRSRATRPDLAGRVALLGPVDDVYGTLRRWTVFVSPSTSPDPALLAVLEAMSVGAAIVATDHGGPPEYLDGAGLLVPPGDPSALRRALQQLLDDPDERARRGALSRARVDEHYRLEPRMAELLAVVDAAARRDGS